MSTRAFSTKDRILDAAEHLFALHGFAATSLRQVTELAEVHGAAVNYHFGNKDMLIQEVFRRRIDSMSGKRLAQLAAAQAVQPVVLEEILAAFIEPALAMARGRKGRAFVRVIARAYAENNASLRKFLSAQYGHVQREFAHAIATAVPHLERRTLYWRLDFLAGELTYVMSEFGLIKRPAGVSEALHHARAARQLIQYAAAGFRAPLPPSPSP